MIDTPKNLPVKFISLAHIYRLRLAHVHYTGPP
jgi:hypothetical protein